MNLSV
jgi:hypothetical protein